MHLAIGVIMEQQVKIELIKTILASIDDLLKWSFILNGASAAGLLTFLGNTVDKRTSFHCWSLFGSALIAFGIGLVLVVAAGCFKLLTVNYIAQIKNTSNQTSAEELKIYLYVGDCAIRFGLATVVVFMSSVLCFLIGIFVGRFAIFG